MMLVMPPRARNRRKQAPNLASRSDLRRVGLEVGVGAGVGLGIGIGVGFGVGVTVDGGSWIGIEPGSRDAPARNRGTSSVGWSAAVGRWGDAPCREQDRD